MTFSSFRGRFVSRNRASASCETSSALIDSNKNSRPPHTPEVNHGAQHEHYPNQEESELSVLNLWCVLKRVLPVPSHGYLVAIKVYFRAEALNL